LPLVVVCFQLYFSASGCLCVQSDALGGFQPWWTTETNPGREQSWNADGCWYEVSRFCKIPPFI